MSDVTSEMNIRAGREADLEPINEIYNHYVHEAATTFDIEPTTAEQRRPWMERFGSAGRYKLVVAEQGGCVLGYAASLPFRVKAAYETSVETTIYLHPERGGRGLGSLLYEDLFKRLTDEDLHRAYAGITLPNPESIGLHRKFGFQAIGIYREVGRKFGRYWDVQWFEKVLS